MENDKLDVKHIEKCWGVLTDADIKLTLRFTGDEYTDNVLQEIKNDIKIQKENLKVILNEVERK